MAYGEPNYKLPSRLKPLPTITNDSIFGPIAERMALALLQHEESLIREVLRHCSVCGRPTPWNPGNCCYPGDGSLRDWTLVRKYPETRLTVDPYSATLEFAAALEGIWCPDCPGGVPKSNPWWMRL
jgi:hypothetical protein